ncbi:MAG: hypothetical protein JWQ49_6698 [Edaphobacter sp.]|nr:hypothetical protein [Edaphobacter sp.]
MPPTPKSPVPPIPCQLPQPPDYPPSPNVKKIFVFLDGTGNEFIADSDPRKANSNVVKLYTTLKVAGDQVAYYQPGVGTMGDPTIRWRIPRYWSMIKGLAFGAGFKANVLDAYRYLMEVYNDGDQIYIFGFSRGSYTARALASLLHGYGLLCRGNEGHLLFAWRMMIDEIEKNRKQLKKDRRKRKPKSHTIKRNDAFAQTFSRIVTIRFMGIWDTVSSVGWIYTPIRLLDAAQNPIIQVGRHAVSIDERRAFYRDNLWGELVDINDSEWPETLRRRGIQQDIAQVWFPGAHSDVGGSYSQTEAAPANEALSWIIGELQQHGAQLCQDRIEMVLGTPTGILAADSSYHLPKSPDNKLHDSLDWHWWLLQFFPQQYYDKDDEIAQWRVPIGRPRSIPDGAIIHHSVERRIRNTTESQDPYTPHNLNLSNLHLIHPPTPETTANLTGCFIHKTPDGKASVPDDPTPVRYAKLGFGWIFFVIFGLFVVSVLVFLIGGCRILATHVFNFLNQCAWIHSLFTLLHSWLIG